MQIRMLIHELIKEPRFRQATDQLVAQHVSGEGDVLADLVSRALWEKFSLICDALRVKPIPIHQTDDELSFAQQVVDRAAEEKFLRPPTLSESGTPRHRYLLPLEQGRGRKRRDQEQCDGPFTPPLVRTATPEAPAPVANTKPSFQPAFVRKARTHRREEERVGATKASAATTSQNVAYYTTPARPMTLCAAETGARLLADKLAKDPSPGRINSSHEQLYKLALSVETASCVQMVMHGLVQRFLNHYGMEMLRPCRVEPMTMHIVHLLVQAAKAVNICVGSRKGESTLLPLDTDLHSCVTRDCLSWRMSGRVMVSNPIVPQLEALLEAKLYSPHSWRVGMASALKVARATDAQIQAFGRWMSPDSIKIYARFSVLEYTKWMDRIIRVYYNIDALRTTSFPVMDADGAFAPFASK
ncbi:MAG: hypothetical protein SGPRY_009881 [Prymnesium sp.]